MSAPENGGARMILKSETYHFHRLDLTLQAGFIVTIYDDGSPARRHCRHPHRRSRRRVVDRHCTLLAVLDGGYDRVVNSVMMGLISNSSGPRLGIKPQDLR